jgi:hypothetical protein
VLLIQETKLRNAACDKLKTGLWRQAASWVLDASPGYGNGDDLRGAGKGGIATFLAPQYEKYVARIGSVMLNRAQWITL